MTTLFTKSLSDKVVDKEGILVLPLKLLLTKTTDCFKCLFLDAFENLIVSFLVLVGRLEDLVRVSFPACFELLERRQVQLLTLDC